MGQDTMILIFWMLSLKLYHKDHIKLTYNAQTSSYKILAGIFYTLLKNYVQIILFGQTTL